MTDPYRLNVGKWMTGVPSEYGVRMEVGCIHPEHGGHGDRLFVTINGEDVYRYGPPPPETKWVLEKDDGTTFTIWGRLLS